MRPFRSRFAASVLAAIAFSSAVATPARGSQFDAFLRIEGINGETESTRPGWIEIQSYSFAVPPPAPPAAPAPAGVARKGPGMFRFVKRYDKASPQLKQAQASGKVLPTVVLDMRKAPGSQTYLRYELKNVMISSYTVSGQGAGDSFPTETISFNYGAIEVKYEEQKTPPKGVAPNRAAAVGNMSAAPAPSPTRAK